MNQNSGKCILAHKVRDIAKSVGVSKIGQSEILTTSVSPQNERSQHPRRCWLLLFCGIVARGGSFLVDTFQNIVTNDRV